ncbi:metallophosphoesterase [Lacticigenium naphthae]|uniref:metallophosphoesterase n=1 Tax=Lacticigenium naphthae TaxID=515351 RepID=UPI000416EF57|nr:metallophosphoesterase [Lacticigenium naphthae]
MFTKQRLNEAYKRARVEYIDADAKYAIVSDAHRGNGNMSDEFARNSNIFLRAIRHYYNYGYVLIEAGDGDELIEYSEFEHIKNAHPDVYGCIKRLYDEDRYIRLWGNHDLYIKNKRFVRKNYYTNYDEFNETKFDFLKGFEPVESLILRHRHTGQELFVAHGQQGDAPNDQFWFFTMLSLKYFWKFFHHVGIKNPTSPVKNVSKRHRMEKNYIEWIEENKTALICGHTHRFKFAKNKNEPYFNSGCCIYPQYITALEIKNEEIQLVRWQVKVDQKGSLSIKREVMRGPEPISEFDIREDKKDTDSSTPKETVSNKEDD